MTELYDIYDLIHDIDGDGVRQKELIHKVKQPGGTTCPLCSGHMQIYRRKFNCNMAYALLRIYQTSLTDWVNIGELLFEKKIWPSDYAKLRWWGLIDKHPRIEKEKKSSGLYRITDEGIELAEGYTTVMSHAIEYKSHVLQWDGGEIDISTALEYGNKFKYDELMNQRIPDGLID